MKILIDTNVIMDIFQKREPFFADSYPAVRRAIKMGMVCQISASSATDIFYLLRKSLRSADTAWERMEQLSRLVAFADVRGADIHTALMHTMPDFEDAVLDAVAKRHGASLILTRNIRDFAGSTVPAVTPADFLDRFQCSS